MGSLFQNATVKISEIVHDDCEVHWM